MKEHSMAFRGDMVRALLGLIKDQTRRPIDPQPPEWAKDREVRHIAGNLWGLFARHGQAAACQSEDTIRCPWQVGDRIWVKESFCLEFDERTMRPTGKYLYEADGEEVVQLDDDGGLMVNKDGSLRSPWRRAQIMPSEASRLTLEITEIRAQRIQDISEEDAKDEGIQPLCLGCIEYLNGADCEICGPEIHLSFRIGCEMVWESLYPGSWARNDWVWALTFKVVEAKGRAE